MQPVDISPGSYGRSSGSCHVSCCRSVAAVLPRAGERPQAPLQQADKSSGGTPWACGDWATPSMRLTDQFNKSAEGLQGHRGGSARARLHRDPDRRDCRLYQRQAGAHRDRAGLRGRHRQHDAPPGRTVSSGLSGGGGRRQGAVRSQGLRRPGLRATTYSTDRRQAAVDAVHSRRARCSTGTRNRSRRRGRRSPAPKATEGSGLDGRRPRSLVASVLVKLQSTPEWP